jgi:hypothetical protein
MKTLTAASALMTCSAVSAQGVVPVRHSCVYDAVAREVEFTIEFSGPPDFFVLGPNGFPLNEFQFYIRTTSTGWWDTIVRGGEIRFYMLIPFRTGGTGGGGGSGGWGPILGMVPYTLTGNVLTFTARFEVVQTGTGLFTYGLQNVRDGSQNYWSPGNLSVSTTCYYANCDGSTITPMLNVADFTCFLRRFAAGDTYANCDSSTATPVLQANDFVCYLERFALGCP